MGMHLVTTSFGRTELLERSVCSLSTRMLVASCTWKSFEDFFSSNCQ